MKASWKLRICWLIAALFSSSAGAETRVYGAFTNDYVFRGISSSDDQPSVSVGIDWQHPSGAYVGSNMSSVQKGVELDAYGGFTKQFGVFAVDVGASDYEYSDHGYIDGSYREVYVGGQAGPVGVSVYRGRSPFAGSHYWYAQVDAAVPAGPVAIELHYGVTEYAWGARVSDQYAGISARWHGLDWRVRLTHRAEFDDDVKFVAAISKSWTVNR